MKIEVKRLRTSTNSCNHIFVHKDNSITIVSRSDWCFLYESLALQSTTVFSHLQNHLLVTTCSWWWILTGRKRKGPTEINQFHSQRRWMKWLLSCAQSPLLPEQISTQTMHVHAQLHKKTLNLRSFCLWYGQGQPLDCILCIRYPSPSPSHSSAADKAWYWPKQVQHNEWLCVTYRPTVLREIWFTDCSCTHTHTCTCTYPTHTKSKCTATDSHKLVLSQ